ncbi:MULTISPECIES: hypothetical protein [Kitasatospora]|uniref:Uncharacterized protein n=1 Tax=Kitasatospora setae (strain ATCC 33774 / DSM 43861 / JCM 3304 / KCC A-0304 / NBRC 14216 / KM-6054) TaxID=452652 RepID=E4N540_KITSK|nr:MULTISPECIES: hypothetical protein [Kitasatospora]BAJ26321.1 hypothetical protein KSE_04750 [Kitasatospora setae KM-6054]
MATDMQELFDLDVQDLVAAESPEHEEAAVSLSCEGSCTRPFCI